MNGGHPFSTSTPINTSACRNIITNTIKTATREDNYNHKTTTTKKAETETYRPENNSADVNFTSTGNCCTANWDTEEVAPIQWSGGDCLDCNSFSSLASSMRGGRSLQWLHQWLHVCPKINVLLQPVHISAPVPKEGGYTHPEPIVHRGPMCFW